MYAIIGGIALGIITIWAIKMQKAEEQPWAYPLLLSTFPFYYFAFALFADDKAALGNELVYAVPIFLCCIGGLLRRFKYSALCLSFGFMGHGFYDLAHNSLFINQGSPLWWPQFCGSVDLFIGLYLFVWSSRRAGKSTNLDLASADPN